MAAVARVLLFIALVVSVAGPAHAQSEPLRTTILRVDPNQPPARDVYLGVSDSRGLPVTGLDKSAFTLTEDGKPVSIDRVGLANDSQQPLAFGMLIDVSGSMNDGGKLDAAKRAADRLIASLGPADTAAVISFADQANVVQEFTGDRGALNRAIDGLQAGGDTALYDAVVRGALLSAALPQARRVILLVTDGDDTRSTAKVDDALRGVAAGRSLTYAIGLGNDVNHNVLDRITQAAGTGQSFYPGDPSDLDGIFQSILDQLRQTYVLRYNAPDAPTGNHMLMANVEYQGQTGQSSSGFTFTPTPIAADINGVLANEVVTGPRQVQAVVRTGAAQKMDLLVDGQPVASSSGQPSVVTGNLAALPPGAHSVSVRVTDAAGAVTENQVPITVPAPAATVTPEPVPTVTPPDGHLTPQPELGALWTWLLSLLLLVLVAVLAFALVRRQRPATVAAGATAAAVADDRTREVDSPDGLPAAPVTGPRLVIERGGQQHEVALTGDSFGIGREDNNDLVLRDMHVSRHHALISLRHGEYWLEDLNSQNGTLLDGRVRIDRKQLVPGDQFSIGDTMLVFAAASPTPGAPTPQAAATSDQKAGEPIAVAS